MTRVLTFGESMAALHGEGPLRLAGGMQLSIAGTESNVAIGLARLGHQAEWIGRLGDDELGRLVLRTLRAENVDVSHVIVDGSAPTGLLLFEHRIADITNVSYYRAGSAGSGICADDVARRLTDDVAALHVTGVTAALGNTAAEAIAGCVEIARRRGIPVSLDVNFRSRLWSAATARDTLRPLVSQVEILFGSEDEVMLVAADGSTDIDIAAQQIIADGTGTVVVKRGGAGATAYTINGKLNVPARRVPVVDVVGAGDAFVAGYLSGRLDGLDIAGCIERGVVLGAFAVSRIGDWEALPSRAELSLLDAAPGTTVR
jgi:2-dehydro-3-deoxygluconokinase